MPLAKRLLIVTSILFAFGVLVKPHYINSVSLQQLIGHNSYFKPDTPSE